MKKIIFTQLFLLVSCGLLAQQTGNFSDIDLNMGNLCRLSDAKTRSIR